MRYSIVIPTYNKCKEALKPCIESILKYTDLTDTEIIIVANGCTDETKDFVNSFIPEYPTFKLLWFDEPIGYTKAGNEGLKVAKGAYIVLLNNDTVLLDQNKNDWLKVLSEPFEYDNENGRKVAITGPMKTLCPSAGRDFLIFFCVMICRDALEKVGLMDEVFSPGYGEDTDWCLRAEDMGYEVKQVPTDSSLYYGKNRMVGNFPIYHEGNVTFRNWEGGEELLQKNNEILRERYNKTKISDIIDISKALKCDGFMTEQELMWLAKQAKTQPIIIEVGSWHGKSTRALGDNTCGVVYSIDHWQGSAAERDTHHASAKMMNGDHAYYEFLQNNFDLVREGKIIPIRLDTKNASNFFKEKGIKADMVFIDAGHTYDEVRKDIENWLPVIKDGGMLCGHDYIQDNFMQVKEAVDSMLSPVEHIHNTSIWTHRVTEEILKPAVYDCFPLFNELDLLEIRFNELFDVVDRFIIVEATKTHGGLAKPLYFDANKERFMKFLHKVSYVVVDDYPSLDSLGIEKHQRNCIMRAMDGCKNDSIVIISDIDEIPKATKVMEYIDSGSKEIMSFSLDECFLPYNNNKWRLAKICRFSSLKEKTPCGIRYLDVTKIYQ